MDDIPKPPCGMGYDGVNVKMQAVGLVGFAPLDYHLCINGPVSASCADEGGSQNTEPTLFIVTRVPLPYHVCCMHASDCSDFISTSSLDSIDLITGINKITKAIRYSTLAALTWPN